MSADPSRGAAPAVLLRSVPQGAGVLDTLRRHGFGNVLVGGPPWPEPDRVRAALEELGLVYVKFGRRDAVTRLAYWTGSRARHPMTCNGLSDDGAKRRSAG